MNRVAVFPMAALALLVLIVFVGTLLWALLGSRRSAGVFAALAVLGVMFGIPVLLFGLYSVRSVTSVRTHTYAFPAAQENAAESGDAGTAMLTAPRTDPAVDQLLVPNWVRREPRTGKDGEVLRTVSGARFATRQKSVDDALRVAAEQARDYLQQASPRPVRWEVPLSFVQDELVRDEYVAQVDWEAEGVDSPPFAEPMYQAHLLLALTPPKRDALLQMWQDDVLGERMRWLVGGSAFLLVFLATLAGYLRLDEATRGYYSGRLKLAAVAVVGVTGAALVSVLA